MPSQKLALHGMITGRNICLTGSAGTGKTHLIQIFKKWAQQNNKKMAVTALTGTAAFLLGGKTIHSWSGIGISNKTEIQIINKINSKFIVCNYPFNFFNTITK